MNLSQQTKPYPRTMYHLDHDKPKVVNSKAEEAEASTKGWIVSYIYKEYPKWVGDKIVRSRAEEEQLLASKQPVEVISPPIDMSMSGNLATEVDSVGADPWLDGIETEEPTVTKEVQVDGQDTAVIEKPKEGNGRRKKK
jgi:hypothetical protein